MRKSIIAAVTAAALTAALCPAISAQGIQFNPEPITGNRALGISVGVVTKQLAQGDIKMPWMYLDYLSGDSKAKQSAALQIGLTWSPEFRYGIGLQTGIFYELSADSYKRYYIKIDEHTLSIPLRVQWRYEIIRDLSLFIYTGPSFDIGLVYNIKERGRKIDAYKHIDSDFSRFHMMWGVGAGVRWKFLQLNIGGDWGLTPLYKGESGAHLNKPFHITLSYRF